ncbi:MAG: tripartite tricarboxylate transporter substrate binding protein [Hyphomicrobiales bacterium]|nr:tripartite tricarboxylate transporter substrate binding protein [Hyphomicrobiales bacterium]
MVDPCLQTRIVSMNKIVAGALVLLTFLLPWPCQAQDFPTKPIRIVVPYASGGGTDIVARIIAAKLQEKFNQTVIVENRTGAGGNIGAETVSLAEPDGHTLMFTAQGPLVVNKSLYGKLGYDPDTFTPVSLVLVADMVLLTHTKLAARNVPDLIKLAKANPGRLNYASQGNGTSAHLTAELFKSMAGVNLVHVPYRGSGPALIDLVAGHVDVMFGEIAPARSYLDAGSLRAIAVTGDKRIPSMPEVEAVAETLPGLVVQSWWGMVAPPRTPPGIASRLAAAITDLLKLPDVASRLETLGMIGVGSTTEELARHMEKERKLWAKVIRDSGAKAE